MLTLFSSTPLQVGYLGNHCGKVTPQAKPAFLFIWEGDVN